MTILVRATGLRRATERQQMVAARYVGASPTRAVSYPVQQPIARIIDQGSLGACVGCAMCAGAEAALGIPPRLSWVRLWTDARRRDGNISGNDDGTWFASAIQSAMLRGFDPEEFDEWNDVTEQTEPDDIDSELAAYDTRQTEAEHWRCDDGNLEAVDDALERGFAVGIATGVRDPYFDFFSSPRSELLPELVLGTASLGGSSNGHEQRIVGVEYVAGVRQYFIQNSWGLNGGCHLSDGTFALGCARVSENVVKSAWDVDVIRISKRAT